MNCNLTYLVSSVQAKVKLLQTLTSTFLALTNINELSKKMSDYEMLSNKNR